MATVHDFRVREVRVYKGFTQVEETGANFFGTRNVFLANSRGGVAISTALVVDRITFAAAKMASPNRIQGSRRIFPRLHVDTVGRLVGEKPHTRGRQIAQYDHPYMQIEQSA